jgi:hypothetical protein
LMEDLMTTERLSILAAAAALREFTGPELAAYTGANPNTVRQVLHRERDSRGIFEQVGRSRRSGRGRQAVIWRLTDADVVLDEIVQEEAKVAELRGSTGVPTQDWSVASSSVDRTETLLASAEDAVVRGFEGGSPDEQEALAEIAINLLRAADPDPDRADNQISTPDWWERDIDISHVEAPMGIARFMGVSDPAGSLIRRPLYLERWIPSILPDPGLPRLRPGQDLPSRQWRARRVAAFASLAARRAKGLPATSEDLNSAARAITEGHETLPPDEIYAWIRRIVAASTATTSGLPPVAVCIPSEQSPSNLFPGTERAWHRINAPVDRAPQRHALWVEGWAEPLLASGLIPAVVMSHNGTPESNEVLSEILADTDQSSDSPMLVVASTVDDSRLVARVSGAGGTFYPINQSPEGLLRTVKHAVKRAANHPGHGIRYYGTHREALQDAAEQAGAHLHAGALRGATDLDDLGDLTESDVDDLIEDSEAIRHGKAVRFTLLQEQVHSVLGTLSKREAGVASMRFGLTDGKPKTVDEISKVYGITRERIRQIESKVMSKVRHLSRSQVLHDDAD